jgi:hypothetical protein
VDYGRGVSARPPAPSKIPPQIAELRDALSKLDGVESAEIEFSSDSGSIIGGAPSPVIKSIRIMARDRHDIGVASEAAIQEAATVDPANIQEVAASQLAIGNSYYSSVLSQARQSFVAAVVVAVVGFVLFLVAVAVALAGGSLSASVLSAVGGGTVEVIAGLNFWLYARASSQLDAFHFRLETMQRFLVANSICLGIGDQERDKTMAELVREVAGITTTSASETSGRGDH